MDNISLTLLISLIGFIQTIFMFVLARIFNTHDKLFKAINDTEDKIVQLLDKHYVTNGELTTLEQTLVGEIKALHVSINNLADSIRKP